LAFLNLSVRSKLTSELVALGDVGVGGWT